MPEKDSWCSVGDLKNISINIRERYLNRSTGLWVVDQYDKLKRDFRYWENDLNSYQSYQWSQSKISGTRAQTMGVYLDLLSSPRRTREGSNKLL